MSFHQRRTFHFLESGRCVSIFFTSIAIGLSIFFKSRNLCFLILLSSLHYGGHGIGCFGSVIERFFLLQATQDKSKSKQAWFRHGQISHFCYSPLSPRSTAWDEFGWIVMFFSLVLQSFGYFSFLLFMTSWNVLPPFVSTFLYFYLCRFYIRVFPTFGFDLCWVEDSNGWMAE